MAHGLPLNYRREELHPLDVWLSVVTWGLIVIALYVCSQKNFLFFHTLAELFSIVIAGSVFVVAWNSRHSLQNNYLLIIGLGFFFVGLLDLVHTMAYKGLQVFPNVGADLPTQLWMAARGLESMTFLAAPLFLRRRVRPGLVLGLYGLVTTFLLLAIFTWGIFPVCYVEGHGLTWFKVSSEYVISGILAVALALLWRHRREFDEAVFQWLIWAICLTIGSELAFTFYVGVYDLSNVLGHILKILAFYMIYKALVETALVKPYDLLWRDLKHNEAELRRREEQHRFLFDNMLNGLAYCRMHFKQGKPVDFTYLNVNRAFETLTGLPEVMGKKVSEVIPGIQEADPGLLETYGRVASTRVPERFEYHLKALNMWFDVSVYCPQKEYFVAIFDVITERKLAEEALRQSEARLRLAQEAAKAGTWEWDMRTNENFWSEEIWPLYGLEPHSCQPSYETWLQTIHPEDRAQVEQTVQAASRSGIDLNAEWRVFDPHGQERWLMSRGQPQYDHQNNIVSYLGIVMDITDRKLAEQALRQSLDDKVALLQEVHHRVKNNLQIVASLLSLQANCVQNQEALQALEDTRNRVHSMALLHEVLYRSNNLAMINFADYVDQVIKKLQSSYGLLSGRIKVENQVSPIGLPMTVAVPAGLIITELVSNACKYAFPGQCAGTVTVSLDLNSGGHLVLGVSDNGVGLPKDLNPENNKTLGLRLVQRLASQLGGCLRMNHPEDLGTAFTIQFPAAAAAPAEDKR